MKRICAGIVLYNPSIVRLKKNLNAIFKQVEIVFLVDNGSKNIEQIEKLILKYSNCILIKNNKNLGIAKALNILCLNAYTKEYEWILTLDQDTICPDDLINSLYQYTSNKHVGIICPDVVYEGLKNKNNKTDIYRKDITEIKACMTSGALTNLHAWKEVQGFRNEYFIDFVDNEFCMKLRINKYRIFRVNTCKMYHQLGKTKALNLFGKRINCTHHVSWRYYYMIRNNRVFIKEYREFIPVIKEFIKLWYIIFTGILISDNRKVTINYMIQGYMDGLKNRLGKKKF